MSKSPKLRFLEKSSGDDLDDLDSVVEINRDEYKPNLKAQSVHRATSKVRLLRGGLGSGKTRCGAEHINAICLAYPGALCLIARKDITALKVTTQKEYLDHVVIPETIASFNVNENNLYYKNGSMVIFRETKDPDKILSTQFTAWMLDEATENDSREIVDKLIPRLRQKIVVDGVRVTPPYVGLLCFNPPAKTHWLFALSTEHGVQDFQFSTYENKDNLPEGYIEDLEKRLPPWERRRLLDGEWGIEVRGKPVIHGFSEERNVRSLLILPGIPVIRTWDFGYGHPCCKISQFDAQNNRYLTFRELLGHNDKLPLFAPRAISLTKAFCGSHPVIDFGDPHGADQKDVGEPSIDYLRVHHGIHVNHQRQRIKLGIEEIQEMVFRTAPSSDIEGKTESCFLVDPHCPISIAAYTYGYHQDDYGVPVKDGYFDHVVDCDRYGIVGNRNKALSMKRLQKKYIPKNYVTGY